MFQSMKTIQKQCQRRNIDKLNDITQKVYQDLYLGRGKKDWRTLELIFDEIIKVKGFEYGPDGKVSQWSLYF